MGTKTLLSECFLNRGFTLLQWLLNLVLQIPHFTLNINGQSNTVPKLVSPHDYMHDYLHLPFFSPTYDFFLSHQLYTTASLYSHSYLFSGQKHMRIMIWYDRWITESRRRHCTALWTSACPAVSLARPWHLSFPQTVFWQSACSWLLKHHSAFSVLLVHGVMGEAI